MGLALRGEAHLLHVSQHILPAVKHSLPLFSVQLVDEVCSVVFITVLIPTITKEIQQKPEFTFTYLSLYISVIKCIVSCDAVGWKP